MTGGCRALSAFRARRSRRRAAGRGARAVCVGVEMASPGRGGCGVSPSRRAAAMSDDSSRSRGATSRRRRARFADSRRQAVARATDALGPVAPHVVDPWPTSLRPMLALHARPDAVIALVTRYGRTPGGATARRQAGGRTRKLAAACFGSSGNAVGPANRVGQDAPPRAENYRRAEPKSGREPDAHDRECREREQPVRGECGGKSRVRLRKRGRARPRPDRRARRCPDDRRDADRREHEHEHARASVRRYARRRRRRITTRAPDLHQRHRSAVLRNVARLRNDANACV